MVVHVSNHSTRIAERCGVRCSVFTEHRTHGKVVSVDGEALLMDALARLGVRAQQTNTESDRGIDLVLEPGTIGVQVQRRALVTDDVARRLLAETPTLPDSVLLVVADRGT